MRIGTWNLAGAWSADHAQVMAAAECDVWLLTDVRPRVILAGYDQHLTVETAADGVHWSGILARRTIERLPDPDPASAAVRIDGQLYCSTQLPWPLMPATAHWPGHDLAAQVEGVLDVLGDAFGDEPPVWGGRWHQPLAGNIIGFSPRVQDAILASLDRTGLVTPTAAMADGMQNNVDHIAIPKGWELLESGQIGSPDPRAEGSIAWVDALRPRS